MVFAVKTNGLLLAVFAERFDAEEWAQRLRFFTIEEWDGVARIGETKVREPFKIEVEP